jgi:hypothetical protein
MTTESPATPPATTSSTSTTLISTTSDKPVDKGIQSTEFWTTILVTVAGLFLIGYGAVKEKDNLMMVGSGLAGLPTIGYNVSRGLAKKS